MTYREKVISRQKHGKLFEALILLRFLNYNIEVIKARDRVIYKEVYGINYHNLVSLLLISLHAILLSIFYLPISGFSGVKSKLIYIYRPEVLYHELRRKEKKLINIVTDKNLLYKLEGLKMALSSGYYKAVESFLARNFNIRFTGEIYEQLYIQPENTSNQYVGWYEQYNGKFSRYLTLSKILSDIEEGKVEPIIKISIKEIQKKFNLEDVNPGLIKVVKNKQTDKGFRIHKWGK